MSDRITVEALDLDLLDTDGAIREADAGVAGDTRADFFKKAAVGGGTLIGGGVLLSGLAAPALAKPSKKQDVAILNYALTLEYLEAAFYVEAVSKGAISGDALSAATVVRDHELAHVKFLKAALGKAAVKKPKFDFKNTTGDQATFLATAVALEDTGVAAYAGQGPRLLQKPVVVAALSIHSVEARHAAHFRTLAGMSFAPKAFDKAKTMKQVLKVVDGTGFITG
ncbi:MAG: ferritin-like domain-containing protein [Thermoleophilaceae bacterium]|nr:ferritin-like domain-containing protein [Thermoleophilaceae bacterium]